MDASGLASGDAEVFDIREFLAGLDAIFAAHQGPDRAAPFMLDALSRAEALGDDGARLSIMNELLGLYRSQGRHDEAESVARDAIGLGDAMGLAGTAAHATTLINVATAHRAAGRYAEALEVYGDALAAARATMGEGDRRLAALHNNLSILHSDMGQKARAHDELEAALGILTATSVDEGADLDIATTLTNLSLVCHDLGRAGEAAAHAERSLEIFRYGGHQNDAHYAAAIAGHAEVCLRLGRHEEAVALYTTALRIVADCYGAASDAYAVTAENLADAERALATAPASSPRSSAAKAFAPAAEAEGRAADRTGAPQGEEERAPKGLALSRAFWEAHGKPMLAARYPEYSARIAAGLIGHGSECYGFDDDASRDHDFGPGFCLWLTAADHAEIGERLQADYDSLPQEFLGVGPRRETHRASGRGRRVGVFEVGAFFEGVTGASAAPPLDRPHEWLLIDEATLAAATNGAVFADPLGALGAARDGFRHMPADVRLALLGQRVGMMAQAGQYNVPRMLDRADGEAAWLAVAEFVGATASAVFLLNGPSTVGYLPYYKWRFAALRELAARPVSRLPRVHVALAEAQRLASAACFAGAGFG
ncbi:MAG: tetratricopeptide repeat protein, partial [Demequinaceae bacterium]|nr:tetratricopeptide repeat protein [Demequinaceae bacterium]